MKHILVTGAPGVGKTTVLKKLIESLKEVQDDLDGFLTEEVRNEKFQRIGFSIKLINSNQSTILADKRSHAPDPAIAKLGQYTVYVRKFEDLAVPVIQSFNSGILFIDEIGKMELYSKKFEDSVTKVFKSTKPIRIVATVPIKGPHVVEKLKRDQGCQLINVTNENRDNLWTEILSLLLDKK